MGPYVVDFVCHEPKLVVEVDGGERARRRQRDDRRTRFLEGRGFQVVRVWNNEVLQNTKGILEFILRALRERAGEVGES